MKRPLLTAVVLSVFGLLAQVVWNLKPTLLKKYEVDEKRNLIIYQSGSLYYVWEDSDKCMFEIDLQRGKYRIFIQPDFDPAYGWIFFRNLGEGNLGIDMSTGLKFDPDVPVIVGNQVTVVDPTQDGEKRSITFTLKDVDMPLPTGENKSVK